MKLIQREIMITLKKGAPTKPKNMEDNPTGIKVKLEVSSFGLHCKRREPSRVVIRHGAVVTKAALAPLDNQFLSNAGSRRGEAV